MAEPVFGVTVMSDVLAQLDAQNTPLCARAAFRIRQLESELLRTEDKLQEYAELARKYQKIALHLSHETLKGVDLGDADVRG